MKLEIALIILIILITALVLAVFVALVYPEETAVFMTQIREAGGNGESPFWAAFKSIGTRMRRGFEYRIAPLFTGAVKSFSNSRKSRVTEAPQITARDCLPCHRGLFDHKALNNLYVDHQVHEAAEVGCNQCHIATASGRTKGNGKKPAAHSLAGTIKEKQCLNCHQRRELSNDCPTCHPPGSILAKGIVSDDKLSDFLAGRETAKKSLVPGGFSRPDRAWLQGGGDSPCAKCHNVPETCNRCHFIFHDKLPDWRATHGPRLLKREYAQTVCWQCHNANWCADTCHANLKDPGGPRRSHFNEDVPNVPVENYLE